MAKRMPVTVLVPGRLHPHAVERIGAEFNLLSSPRADASMVDAADRARIRAVASMTRIDGAFIDSFPNLEIIANFGVGYDAVDAAHAGRRGIMVTNTPDVLTEEVADTTIGLLINTVRELSRAETYLRAGRWAAEGNYPLTRLTLRGRRAGIFGLGRIGKAIARRLEAFGLTIAYHNRRPVPEFAYPYFPSLRELAENVDTLVVAAPGGAETEKAVNADVLAALGKNGVLVNIGRGSTVDEEALVRALSDGTIAAAGLDVFAHEPSVPQALLDLPNAVVLPHVGSASIATREAMADLVVDNLRSWFGEGRALTPVAETMSVAPRVG